MNEFTNLTWIMQAVPQERYRDLPQWAKNERLEYCARPGRNDVASDFRIWNRGYSM